MVIRNQESFSKAWPLVCCWSEGDHIPISKLIWLMQRYTQMHKLHITVTYLAVVTAPAECQTPLHWILQFFPLSQNTLSQRVQVQYWIVSKDPIFLSSIFFNLKKFPQICVRLEKVFSNTWWLQSIVDLYNHTAPVLLMYLYSSATAVLLMCWLVSLRPYYRRTRVVLMGDLSRLRLRSTNGSTSPGYLG